MKIAFAQHPDEDLLEQYLMARLPESTVAEMEEHLLLCSLCQDRAEALEMIIAAIQATHVEPRVLPFRTHLPQYSLKAAAGKFGQQQQIEVEPEGWVEVPPDRTLTEDMFVTHIKGHSMEPDIPDGSLCAFKTKVKGSYEGKVLLLEQYSEAGGNRYTIKLYRASQNPDPHGKGDKSWLHERLTLESINPDYEDWDVPAAENILVLAEFAFVLPKATSQI